MDKIKCHIFWAHPVVFFDSSLMGERGVCLSRIPQCRIGLLGKVRAQEARWWLSVARTCIMAAQLG